MVEEKSAQKDIISLIKYFCIFAAFAFFVLISKGKNYFIGLLWGSGILVVYVGIVFYVWMCCDLFKIIKSNLKAVYKVGVFLLISAFVVVCLIERDHTVYFWDYSAYWKTVIDHARLIFEDPVFMIKNMIYSLNYYEYNHLIPTLMALPIRICGNSYTIYVLLTYIMFQIPMYITLILLLCRISYGCFERQPRIEYIAIGVILLPTVFYPTLYGYIDVSGAVWQSLIMLLIYEFDFSKFDRKKSILLATLMLLLILTRRYYAYFGVGMVVGILGKILVEMVSVTNKKIYIKETTKNLMFIGGICLGILVIFFRPFLYRSIVNNYQTTYSAYNMGNVIYNYKQILVWFGIIVICLAIAGAVAGCFVNVLRSYLTAVILSVIVATFLIFQVLTMGMHQYYIISPQIVVCIGIFLLFLFEQRRYIVFGASIIALCLNFLASFNIVYRGAPSSLFSGRKYVARVRTDLEELQSMANDAKKAAEGDGKVVITASSDLLNSDILRNLYLPYNSDYFPNLSYFCDVDLRDGFPVDVLNADVIIATDPVQYHLQPEGQRVVGFFNSEFYNGGKLSAKFKVLGEYHLDGGITAKMLKRTAPFSEDDLQYIIDYFDQFYKDYADLFRNRISQFLY